MKRRMAIFCLFASTAVSSQNFYIAHRGASFDAPENTVASVKLAWEVGADAAEIDVYLSVDNRVMVIHDKDTRRICSGENYIIKETPSSLLRTLDAGSWKGAGFKGERIPFLEEILATIPEGKTLVVEVKCGSEIIPYLDEILSISAKKPQLVFISFGWDTILGLKKSFPGNKAYWLTSSKAEALKKMDEAAAAGLDGINMQFSAIDNEVLMTAQKNNLQILAWTVDNPEEVKRLQALGVKYFTTNRPQWLKQQL
jgi:glycerophosphoryl diester phosphodiesterase